MIMIVACCATAAQMRIDFIKPSKIQKTCNLFHVSIHFLRDKRMSDSGSNCVYYTSNSMHIIMNNDRQ